MVHTPYGDCEMASKRPRVTMLMTDEIMEELRAFSSVTGASISSVVVDLLTPQLPSLRATREMYSSLKSGEYDAAKKHIDDIASIANGMVDELNRQVKVLDND